MVCGVEDGCYFQAERERVHRSRGQGVAGRSSGVVCLVGALVALIGQDQVWMGQKSFGDLWSG
jgi:hypothetical protein